MEKIAFSIYLFFIVIESLIVLTSDPFDQIKLKSFIDCLIVIVNNHDERRCRVGGTGSNLLSDQKFEQKQFQEFCDGNCQCKIEVFFFLFIEPISFSSWMNMVLKRNGISIGHCFVLLIFHRWKIQQNVRRAFNGVIGSKKCRISCRKRISSH